MSRKTGWVVSTTRRERHWTAANETPRQGHGRTPSQGRQAVLGGFCAAARWDPRSPKAVLKLKVLHAAFSAITIGIFQGLKGVRNNASVIMIASRAFAVAVPKYRLLITSSQLLNPLVYGLTLLATLNSYRRWMSARDGKTFSMASVGRSKSSFRMKVRIRHPGCEPHLAVSVRSRRLEMISKTECTSPRRRIRSA